MEKYINLDILKPREINKSLSAYRSQEKWRQKQINIFYRSGRPIFNTTIDKNMIYIDNKY
jgi:hypothetical protein